MAQTKQLQLAVLAFNNMTALDMVGPFEVFATALQLMSKQQRQAIAFRSAVIGLNPQTIRAESGLQIVPDFTINDDLSIDTLIVPGGFGLRDPKTNRTVAEWLRAHHQNIRRIASTCTGIYGLAASGLLDQRRVTTHWHHAADVSAKFPQLMMQADAIFVRDGKFYTSAGITAGIDLALALVEEDFGNSIALAAARELVVYLRRSGGQSQYSEPLQFQAKSGDVFADLISWIHGHLKSDLSVAVLAERVGLSVRQFNRRFHQQFNCAPAQYIETLRLNEARQRLLHSYTTIDVIAGSVGFRSSDVFRRAFSRRFGISPSDYLRHFGGASLEELS